MTASTATLDQPLRLPCGTTLKNRILKSAMSEGLATGDGRATGALCRLYRRWTCGGAGTLVTGNVMVDGRALVEPGVVVLEDERHGAMLEAWALEGRCDDTQLFMQLSHPGKQAPRGINREALAPSAVPLARALRPFFAPPRELTGGEIEDIVERFGRSAALAKAAGFSGVQVHGAHGYLVSQFLSPHHNQRDDGWGGSAEKRMRFALAVCDRIRQAVGPGFPVCIKLNSADFQRGGFSEEESLDVVSALSERGIDLIEISGGTYEAPAMARGPQRAEPDPRGPQRASTVAREAYFLEFAEKARQRASVPLCVTGGFRTRAGVDAALRSGALDLVGFGRALALDPDLPRHLLADDGVVSKVRPLRTGVGPIDRTAFMDVAFYARQLHRMARGRGPRPDENLQLALAEILVSQGVSGLRTRLSGRKPAPAAE